MQIKRTTKTQKKNALFFCWVMRLSLTLERSVWWQKVRRCHCARNSEWIHQINESHGRQAKVCVYCLKKCIFVSKSFLFNVIAVAAFAIGFLHSIVSSCPLKLDWLKIRFTATELHCLLSSHTISNTGRMAIMKRRAEKYCKFKFDTPNE